MRLRVYSNYLFQAFFLAYLTSSVVQSQDTALELTPAVQPDTTISVADIEEEQKLLESSELDAEAKKQVTDLFAQAVDQAKKTEAHIKQLAVFQAAKDSASERAEDLKQRLEQQKRVEPATVSATDTLPDLEQRLPQVDQAAKDLRAKLVVADGAVAARSARRKVVLDRLTEIRSTIENEPQAAEPNGEAAALTTAKRLAFKTRRQMLEAEIPLLEAEIAALDAEKVFDIPRLDRDLIAEQLAYTENELQVVQEEVTQRSKDEASEQIAAAKQEAEQQTDPTLRWLADRNVTLAEQYKKLTQDIADAKDELKAARTLRDRWQGEASSAEEKVNSIGLTDTIGGMLRMQKLSLPNPNTFLASIRNRSELLGEAQLQLIDRDAERKLDLDETLMQRPLELRQPIDTPVSSAILEQAEPFISKRNEILAPLVRAQGSYYDTLVALSNTEQQIANEITTYGDFIDERVLWVRSSPPLWQSFSNPKSDLWLVDRSRWRTAKEKVLADLSDRVLWYLAAGLLLGLLLKNQWTLRSRLREYGELAKSGRCTDFTPTFATVLTTALAALPWPALFAFFAWRLSRIAGGNEALRALGHGGFSVAVGYYPLEFFRLVCKPYGLATSHFGWPAHSVQLVRRSLRAIMLVGLPLVLLTAMLSATTSGLGTDTFERLTFIAVTCSLSYSLKGILDGKKGAFSGYLNRNSSGWISRLQPIWYWLFVLAPLALTGLTIFGYYYTAQQLAWRLYSTACLLGVVLLATALIYRWLLVQRRKLSIEQAKQRRAAQLASEDETAVAATTVEELPSAEDLRAQIAQSRNLLRTIMVGVALVGVWIAWVDVLPALKYLEQRPLWDSTKQVTEMVTDDNGDVSFESREVLDPVTIADVAFALLILGLIFVSARNVPGVLEISILQQLPIEASVRYAITTIVSYCIVVAGLVLACQFIGLHWNQVQWMATALTFGLAFGLQEMFANFVAGIIILFERPIRVGDIVTVDDISGVVSRVQIRATTITNWDRKDYIVPNKDFITGRVLNWTLSDHVNRIVVNVGVAYGSDTQLALDTLKHVAVEHPLVVDDPAPFVSFEGFGDSSLTYVLRCYISMKDMPSRLQVVNDLHMGIDNAFREAKIEIAFPSRDLHIRTMPESMQIVLPESNGPAKQKK